MKVLFYPLNKFKEKLLIAALTFCMLFTIVPIHAAVNHVVSNPGPEVFNKFQEIGYFDTRGVNTTANGLLRGNRLAAVLDGYLYLSENTNTCGGMNDFGTTGPLGVLIIDVRNPANPSLVGNIDDPAGLGSSNLAAFKLANGQNILIRMTSNACAVPQPFLPQKVAEGIDVYNVDNPSSPVFLTHVVIPELNNALRAQLSPTDPSADHLAVSYASSVIQKDGKTYVSFSVGVDSFNPSLGASQIWDFSNPNAPMRLGYWGSEMVQVQALGLPITLANLADVVNPNLKILTDYVMAFAPPVLGNSFGVQLTRSVYPMLMLQNGKRALVPMAEGGLALLNIKDPSNPQLISTALDMSPDVFNLSKSVYSTAAAITPNGKTVVELDRDGTPYFLSVTANGGSPIQHVLEGSLTKPIASLPGAAFSGKSIYVGPACGPVIAPPAGITIAIASRGVCTFATKMENIRLAGYSDFIMINSAAAGDTPIGMAGAPITPPGIAIPGVGTSFAAGTALFGSNSLPAIGTLGPLVSASVLQTNWGYVRIWDYSDENNPKLASTFQTLCSSDASLMGSPSCPKNGLLGGQFDTVNVTIKANKAYIGWAQDGLVVIDIKDPYHPVEVARFTNDQASHGVHRIAVAYLVNAGSNVDDPLIYITDADLGVYILKMKGK